MSPAFPGLDCRLAPRLLADGSWGARWYHWSDYHALASDAIRCARLEWDRGKRRALRELAGAYLFHAREQAGPVLP